MRMLAPLLCVASFLAYIHCEDVFGIVGENFTFPVEIDQKIVELTWKKNKDKVAEWEGQKTYFSPLLNRSVLMENGSLTIFDLNKSDAGAYELHYWDSVKDHYLNFKLVVLDPLPEPKISCNTSGGNLVLNCIADFQGPLSYTWKLTDDPHSYQSQELSIPLENVDPTRKAACVIKFSRTAMSSEISLIQCHPDEKGDSSHKRNRGGLIAALVFVLFFVLAGILVFILWKGRIKCKRGRRPAHNLPAHGSGEQEQLVSGNSQEQPNSDRATFSQTVHCENEKPEADRELNKEDSALKDKQAVSNGENQEGSFKKNNSLLANHADDHGINEGDVTHDAEAGNGKHLNNAPSCSKEDLKS